MLKRRISSRISSKDVEDNAKERLSKSKRETSDDMLDLDLSDDMMCVPEMVDIDAQKKVDIDDEEEMKELNKKVENPEVVPELV